MDIREELDFWKEHVSGQERAELEELAAHPDELQDAFYRELAFGTAGLRGIIGLGPNRMNVYTVGKATQGFADYLNAHFDKPSVALARDSRHKGVDFIRVSACVLAANGIRAYVFDDIQPTPVLSFAVRKLGCCGGINITASHNPAEYNGYKAYGPDGCQIKTEAAHEIQDAIDELGFFDDVHVADYDDARGQGLIVSAGADVVESFLDAVAAQSVEPLDAPACDLKVVYTPLNGTGLFCVKSILSRVGIHDVHVVPEQAEPDGDFPTCPYPNPEFREALERGLALCEKVHPDLLLATDPDADRVGIAVPHEGDYELLTGNEVGVLLLDYICSRRKARGEDLSRAVAVTTIVSSLMPDALAKTYGFELRRVLTGFKYIGGQIGLLEDAGEVERFIFGYEESYGYMSGPHVRDKDAVNASMLICQMANWYKGQGFDLVEAMERLYETYGFYLNRTVNVQYPGSAGAEKMRQIMERLRKEHPAELAGMSVSGFTDFGPGIPMPTNDPKDEQMLPPANVVSFELAEGTKVLVRPSGTEPKIKAYLFAKADDRTSAEKLLDELEADARKLLE
ncbi:MAG: phospho-sugar mutase [Coriobacteriales bacterium]|jgi:phosphoglucomutase